MRLLLSTNMTPERELVRQAAQRAGYQTYGVGYTDPILPGEGDVLYGGVMWGDVIASRLGLHLRETPLDWLATADPSLTGRHIRLTTVQEVWDNPRNPHRGEAPFYKPLDGKSPEPGLYNGTEMPGEPDTVLLRQGVLDISLEVRTFVLDGEIRTASAYALDGTPFVSPFPRNGHFDTLQELASIAAETSAPATVMDFARTDEGRWVLLEQNAPWCSAFYACDPDLAFPVVQASCSYEPSDFDRARVKVDPPKNMDISNQMDGNA